MRKRNPYAISFGKLPTQYISRNLVIDSILDSLEETPSREQAFKLTGIRGTGKTVTLTAIENQLKQDDSWIVVDLRANGNLLEDLLSNLYSSVPFITQFIDASLNLSVFGIGINLSNASPISSIDYAIKQVLYEIQKKNKKVLVTIDEARKTPAMIDFVQAFQILIREELPIYFIAAGLYEDIESIENADGLTFFLRAEKYEMTPLNHMFIRNDYQNTLQVSYETADEMAAITKGYAFAYQALGKYMWEAKEQRITDAVLAQLDEALAEKVYKKIWSELTKKDRWFLSFIATKDCMSANELLTITQKKHNEWSEPRKRLSEKGIINTKTRGQIQVCLPRLHEFIKQWE